MPAALPPVLPQLALSRVALPEGEDWSYEPKWDGFRAIAFVDGDEIYLQSRNGKPLSALLPRAASSRPGSYVLDGELVILGEDGKQDFDALQQRIHPAESRIRMLAEEMPVRFVAFDLLAADGEVAARRAVRARAASGSRSWCASRSTSRPCTTRARARRTRGCRAPRA